MATNIYFTSYPENPPEWYWTKGLHDAGITEVESFEFPFDYNKFVGQKSKYNRNLLKLKIDSKGAIYGNNVYPCKCGQHRTFDFRNLGR